MIDSLSSANNEILQLRSEIRKHNHLYYDLDTPEITDLQYDSLLVRLKTISPDDPILNEMGNFTFGTKVEHTTMMGSLDKVHTLEEIVSKFNGLEVCIMPKVDGLSLALRYQNGHLDWAATRGNGKVGELVTPNATRIEGLPLQIGSQVSEVRGEAFIAKTDFYGIMDQPGYDDRENGYANPRNAAAGAVRQKDPKEVFNRHVSYVAYKVIGDNTFKTQSDVLEWLELNNFKTVHHWVTIIGQGDDLADIIEHIRTESFDYNIDGAVIMVNDLRKFEDMGHGSKCPRGALAYKYETEQVQSVARKIEWEANRSGRIIPVLTIDETEIDGTNVSRMSLHNYSWMMAKDVAIGDKILFTKANEIIPYLTEVVERVPVRDKNIPTQCPSCSGPIEMTDVDLMCNNDECPAKFIKHIRRILQILDVKGIDEKTLIKMEEAGLLNNVWDIFDLDLETLLSKGFGKGESPNWIKALTNITTTPACLLACMGILGWGRRMFEILFKDSSIPAEQWVSYITNYNQLKATINIEGISNIDGLGDERAKMLRAGIENRWNIVNQIAQRVTVEYPEVVVGGILEGKSFCATGTLTRKRNDIYAEIISLGGEIKSGVSKDLGYLITGDATGSKLTKAQKLGVTIINEEQLNALMGK